MIQIANRALGPGNPAFIVAEISANHMHSLEITLTLIEESAKAGADAIKIQTLTPHTMTIDCDNEYFRVHAGSVWDGRKLFDLYCETPLPYEWHMPIFDRCKKLGLICFSTPYDISAADFLRKELDPPLYKISSFEIHDTPLIEHVAGFGKPIVLSTGIAEENDIEDALEACRRGNNSDVVLLKCTSAYPAPLDEMNLLTMADMARRFNVVVGLSDHTLSHEAAIVSVALGGAVIEKHVTLDRSLGGPDAAFSITPAELGELVQMVRNAEKLLGEVSYSLGDKARANRVFARSLFFVKDIEKGETVTHEHVRSIRPGHGLKPSALPEILGRRVTRDISRGTPTRWDLFE